MDACHILLGRPWQYDRDVTFNGCQNIYSYVKDGNNVLLLPWRDAETDGTVACDMTPRTTFLKAVKESQVGLALIVLESKEEVTEFPLEVQPLIVDYQDVLADNLPPGLPPLRDIQHAIDLIPGSMLPNRPAYRLRPA